MALNLDCVSPRNQPPTSPAPNFTIYLRPQNQKRKCSLFNAVGFLICPLSTQGQELASRAVKAGEPTGRRGPFWSHCFFCWGFKKTTVSEFVEKRTSCQEQSLRCLCFPKRRTLLLSRQGYGRGKKTRLRWGQKPGDEDG